MKRRIICTVLSIILIVTMMATSALAKDPDTDNETQGKPFQELWEAIAAVEETLNELIDWDDIENVPPDIADGDQDTQLTETQVDAYVANNGYLTHIPSNVMEEGEDVSLLNNDAGYLESYTETDPVFGSSAAVGITADDITKWNTASGGGAGDGHSLDAADGDPQDAVYVDSEGNVGVGTTSPSGIFEVQGTIATSPTVQLDQAQQYRDGVYAWSTLWQSFTASITGELTRIEVYVGPAQTPEIPGKLLIYIGEGISGNPTREQDVVIEQYWHWQAIELNNPLPVQAGEKYTWCIKSTSIYINIRLCQSKMDRYPGGSAGPSTVGDYVFRTYVAPYLPSNLIFTDDANLGIGTEDPGDYRLYVEGSAYASGGWQAPGGDYAEWFEKEEEAAPGDIIGINLETGKARKYRPGDWFIGVCSTNPAYVGNRLDETDGQMAETHILVGLLGQMDFNEEQVVIEGRMVKTTDGVVVGILLNNGKVLIGR